VATASPALPSRPLVLADLVPAVRARDAGLVALGVLFTALLAQVSVPVPGSPVPITGQTLAVVLTAASLGPLRGTAVQVLYIAAALVGLPFYSEASGGVEVVVGATGGYVIGFIPAAFLIGLAARHGADRNPLKALPLFVAGQAVIFAVGVPWLAARTGMTASQALEAGFYPFIVGGIVKAAVAAGVLGTAWQSARRRSPALRAVLLVLLAALLAAAVVGVFATTAALVTKVAFTGGAVVIMVAALSLVAGRDHSAR
jgi:biotin transport system substrate-specific component